MPEVGKGIKVQAWAAGGGISGSQSCPVSPLPSPVRYHLDHEGSRYFSASLPGNLLLPR